MGRLCRRLSNDHCVWVWFQYPSQLCLVFTRFINDCTASFCRLGWRSLLSCSVLGIIFSTTQLSVTLPQTSSRFNWARHLSFRFLYLWCRFNEMELWWQSLPQCVHPLHRLWVCGLSVHLAWIERLSTKANCSASRVSQIELTHICWW